VRDLLPYLAEGN
jgi:hypothetical protein